MKLIDSFRLVAPIIVAAVLPSHAHAENYPTRAITIVSPFAAGGTSDIIARSIAHEISKVLDQSVIVDNRGGAGGNVGAEYVAKAAPDGYTVLVSNSSLLGISPLLYSNLTYDIHKELEPVIVLASGSNVLVVNPAMKVDSVQELIDLAKSKPGKLNFGSSGNGTTMHLSGEMLKQMAKVEMQHIPYRGASPATTALIGGDIDMLFDNVPSSLPFIKAGKLKALAVTGTTRESVLPDVPTVMESGLPDFEVGGWFSLSVPAGTPKDIIAKLNAAAEEGVKSPDFIERMSTIGYKTVGGTPEQMAQMTKQEVDRWKPVIEASGAKID